MPSKTATDVAIRSGTLIAGSFLVVYLLLVYFFNFPEWGLLLVIAIFFAAYFTIKYFTNRFIHQKVKMIYRTIHLFQQGSPKRKEIPESEQKDSLIRVNQDVMNWAEGKIEEIQNLRAQDTFRKEFIGNLSHELKTPVFNIQGYILTLLEGALEDPANNRKFLSKAAKSADRIVLLLEDLDAISQIESGNMELHITSFDLVELTKDVFESLEDPAKDKEIEFRIKGSQERKVLVKADKMRISQVLTNLIVNSIKYGKQSGRTEVRFYDVEDNILVEVSDNGMGMSSKDLPRIFERFYRVDRSRNRDMGGTGLGLAIVKHLVEAHKQTISVRSALGEGSTFSFTLKKG